MIEIDPAKLPMRDDSPPNVLARAAEHMAADGTPWLATLADAMTAAAGDCAHVPIDLTAAYVACDEPDGTRRLFHTARDYLAAVEKRLDGDATC